MDPMRQQIEHLVREMGDEPVFLGYDEQGRPHYERKVAEERCDFCSEPKPTWSFPCRDHQTGVVPTPAGLLGCESYGDWAACEVCKKLIDALDREGLAVRSAKRYMDENPEMKAAITFSVLVRSIREAHDNFWAQREGAPTRRDPKS